MRLTPSQKNELKCELARKINEGKFKKLLIQDEGNGYSAHLEGDLFAIIGAIGHVIYDMSKESDIPVHVLGTYMELAGEMVEEISMMLDEQGEQNEQQQNEQFTNFMDVLTGRKKRGNK